MITLLAVARYPALEVAMGHIQLTPGTAGCRAVRCWPTELIRVHLAEEVRTAADDADGIRAWRSDARSIPESGIK